MKKLFVGVVALLALVPRASFSINMCTSVLTIKAANDQDCVGKISQRARRAGFETETSGNTIFINFGDNVVAARCIRTNIVAMSAVHVVEGQSCPLLDKVAYAIRDGAP